MNSWLGILAFGCILITSLIILIRRGSMRDVSLNILLYIVVGVSLYIGLGASQIEVILLCSIIIGACILLTVIHGYNKLFSYGPHYKPVGEDRRPKSFGNGYWR